MNWISAAWEGVQGERLLRRAKRGEMPRPDACPNIFLAGRPVTILIRDRWINIHPGDPPRTDPWIVALHSFGPR